MDPSVSTANLLMLMCQLTVVSLYLSISLAQWLVPMACHLGVWSLPGSSATCHTTLLMSHLLAQTAVCLIVFVVVEIVNSGCFFFFQWNRFHSLGILSGRWPPLSNSSWKLTPKTCYCGGLAVLLQSGWALMNEWTRSNGPNAAPSLSFVNFHQLLAPSAVKHLGQFVLSL